MAGLHVRDLRVSWKFWSIVIPTSIDESDVMEDNVFSAIHGLVHIRVDGELALTRSGHAIALTRSGHAIALTRISRDPGQFFEAYNGLYPVDVPDALARPTFSVSGLQGNALQEQLRCSPQLLLRLNMNTTVIPFRALHHCVNLQILIARLPPNTTVRLPRLPRLRWLLILGGVRVSGLFQLPDYCKVYVEGIVLESHNCIRLESYPMDMDLIVV
jgi:hypothetical protein